jgi:acyl-CoA thioesterase FadM
MGDAAFLSRLDVRLHLPEVFGDVVRIGGTVTSVGGPRIELELTATNHLGQRTAAATAVVLLDDYGRA